MHKTALIAVYCAYLPVSLLFVAFEATLDKDNSENGWVRAIFGGIHLIHITPIMNLLALVALILQARTVRSNPTTGSLSVPGLAVQAIMFLLVGISWFFRLRLPRGSLHTEPGKPSYSTRTKIEVWYQTVGWATVGNLLFAVVQGVLFLIIRGGRRNQSSSVETAPLLGEL